MSTVDHLADALERIIDPLVARLARLEADVHTLTERLAHLEARSIGPYYGIWDARTSYPRGAAVTSAGSVWIARTDTLGQRPGQPDAASRVWQLAVQRGRDGKASK